MRQQVWPEHALNISLLTKAQIKEKVLAELSSLETVQYIRHIEDDRDKLRAQQREMAKVRLAKLSPLH
jgi:hypothetical protein